MKRPLSLLALFSAVLSFSSVALAATDSTAELNTAATVESTEAQFADLYRLLPGVWNADNCSICKLNVINSGGFLYADMADWGTYGYSYSGGYQPIDVVSNDTFIYRGDYFQFYVIGSQFRVENISNGGDRNVSGATRYTYYPAPIPPRPIPRPIPIPRPPRPIPRPVPRPIPPRPIPVPPRPVPRPVPPRPVPRPVPPRPQPPAPRPVPPAPRPQPPAPRPQPPRPQPPRPAPRPAPGHGLNG